MADLNRTTRPELPSIKAVCTACGSEAQCRHSFRLTKADGKWLTTPVCPKCRRTLIVEAKQAGKFIPFFGLASSQKEADRRNDEFRHRRSLVEKFGKAVKVKDDKSAKPG